ncbi:MAG: nucleotidyltransferase [Planctomycetota bacterium]
MENQSQDFRDMLSSLNNAGVEYLVVGAFAVGLHGLARATKDIDLWVRPTAENAERVWQALVDFGAPLNAVNQDDFKLPDTVFQIGVAPVRIDLLSSVEGLEFDQAWEGRIQTRLLGEPVSVLNREDLLTSKRAAGRDRDLIDADRLENEVDPESRL